MKAFLRQYWKGIAAGVPLTLAILGACWLVWTLYQDHKRLNDVVTFLNQVIAQQQAAKAVPAPGPSPPLPVGK